MAWERIVSENAFTNIVKKIVCIKSGSSIKLNKEAVSEQLHTLKWIQSSVVKAGRFFLIKTGISVRTLAQKTDQVTHLFTFTLLKSHHAVFPNNIPAFYHKRVMCEKSQN